MHFSSPRLDSRTVKRGNKVVEAPPLLSQHADYVHPWEFAGMLREIGDGRFDVMLEAKKKDLALLRLREVLVRIGVPVEDGAE
jgi:UV DNA damage endonuclease